MSLPEPIRVLVQWFPPPVQELSIANVWPRAEEDIPSHLRPRYAQALDIIQLECLAVEREMVGKTATVMMFRQIESMLKRAADDSYRSVGIPVEFTFKWEPDKPKHKCPNCGHEHDR